MTALESLIRKLSPLGIYDITDGSNIKNELAAYAEALERHRANIDEVLRECFIITSRSFGLELREKVIGAVRDNMSLNSRRSMLCTRKGLNESDFTLSALDKFLRGIGVNFYNISENFGMNTIGICVGGSYSDSEAKWIKNQIENFLPAHLDCFVYFGGKTWRQFELQDKTFAQLDSDDLKWQEIHMQ
jgi:hypothetical protein